MEERLQMWWWKVKGCPLQGASINSVKWELMPPALSTEGCEDVGGLRRVGKLWNPHCGEQDRELIKLRRIAWQSFMSY